jgi:hypothetical protein
MWVLKSSTDYNSMLEQFLVLPDRGWAILQNSKSVKGSPALADDPLMLKLAYSFRVRIE